MRSSRPRSSSPRPSSTRPGSRTRTPGSGHSRPREEKRQRAEDLARAVVTGVAAAAGAGLVTVSRVDDRTRAGCVAVGTAGPRNLIEAFWLLRSRVSQDPHVLRLAQEVLSRAQGKGIDPAILEPADAYVVLLELGLLRAESGRLVASKAGEKVLSEA